ncbi:hypothetical protein BDN72DRAFT_838598 [Pluteus cervinus]|uniref:Uncharacterized protein n=1 Tax=Pluteus cervinus TaxID=181527 RepID=A0ACD3AYF9_9AGAR|nr:hypothetical protein BDN72DRAFT_838598 [Pluteus cervinus]
MATILPLELVLDIFELSVLESPRMAPTLMYLSSYIHTSISPLLYRILVVDTDTGPRAPPKESIEKYGHHTRHLLFGQGLDDANQSVERLTIYLRSCPNIINLAIWVDVNAEDEWLDHLKKLPLIRLSVHPCSIWMDKSFVNPVHSLLPCFPQLTHLDLARQLPLSYVPCLRALPNLTYLSMESEQIVAWWKYNDLLNDSPRMKAFIVVRDSEAGVYTESDENFEGLKDPRAISCLVPNYVTDWQRGARGQPDLYDFALEKLNERMGKLDGHIKGLRLS